jgi:hypothetical protein
VKQLPPYHSYKTPVKRTINKNRTHIRSNKTSANKIKCFRSVPPTTRVKCFRSVPPTTLVKFFPSTRNCVGWKEIKTVTIEEEAYN